MAYELAMRHETHLQSTWWKPSEEPRSPRYWLVVNKQYVRPASDIEIGLWQQYQALIKQVALAATQPLECGAQ